MATNVLKEWLVWLVGGGAAIVTTLLIGVLKKQPKFLAMWDGLVVEIKTLISFVVAALLAGFGFWFQVWIGYVDAPAGRAGWFEMLFAIVASQVLYQGVKVFRRARGQVT